MGTERCQAPNPTRPMDRLPLIVSYILISLKACSILSFQTHTHTTIHLAINMAILSPNPNIYHAYHISNLAYIYHASHIKLYPRQQTNEHISSRQEHRHDIKQACDGCLNIQPSMFILIIKVNSNACPYECMTYLTHISTPQHLCINS